MIAICCYLRRANIKEAQEVIIVGKNLKYIYLSKGVTKVKLKIGKMCHRCI